MTMMQLKTGPHLAQAHQQFQAVLRQVENYRLNAYRLSGALRVRKEGLELGVPVVNAMLDAFATKKDEFVQLVVQSPAPKLIVDMWQALPALDYWSAQRAPGIDDTSEITWDRWRAWWPHLWPYMPEFQRVQKWDVNAQTIFPTYASFVERRPTSRHNNFMAYFYRRGVGPLYRTCPAFHRLRGEHPGMVHQLEVYANGDVGAASTSGHDHPDLEACEQLLYAAYNIITGYADLYPVDDAGYFIR